MNVPSDMFVYDDFIKQQRIEQENKNKVTNYKTKQTMYNRGSIMSNEDLVKLKVWADSLIHDGKMTVMDDGRYWQQNLLSDETTNPIVFEIFEKIKKNERLEGFKDDQILSHFITLIPKNACIRKHVDKNDSQNELYHVRFNVFITVPPDMKTYYDEHVVDTVEGCYVLCRSGVDAHWTDVNKCDTPRISLSFGFMLPAEKIDDLTKDVSVGIYTSCYPLMLNGLFSCIKISDNELQNIEERGDTGSSVFTISDVFTTKQCNFITMFMNKHASFWKKNDVSYISGNNVECNFMDLKTLIPMNVPGSKEIDDFIFNIIAKILSQIKNFRSYFNGVYDTGYTLRRIHGGTQIHADGVHSKTGGFKNFVRCLSLIIVLNDDYDGGIFNFPNQGLKLKVKKGEAIMFPPYWTHPHSVTSVGEGQARYTINTWILEKFLD
jgi:hypothetical protein